jgi:hypothetical protein
MGKTSPLILAFGLLFSLFLGGISRAGNIGDPGAGLKQKEASLGLEFTGLTREIRDGDGIRYDSESWRLLLKGSYGITDWLEGYVRAGGATLKIRGTPFDSNPGWAGGGGLKLTFLDPPGHPLKYSLGAQFLYQEAEDRDAKGKWFEYDLWLGASYKDWKQVTPYGGVVYSRVDGKMEKFRAKPALDDFKSPTVMGLFFGVDWRLSERLSLGIDARLFGEYSGTFSAGYRF